MSGEDKSVILLAPGLGGLRRLLDAYGEVVDLPPTDVAVFVAGAGAGRAGAGDHRQPARRSRRSRPCRTSASWR